MAAPTVTFPDEAHLRGGGVHHGERPGEQGGQGGPGSGPGGRTWRPQRCRVTGLSPPPLGTERSFACVDPRWLPANKPRIGWGAVAGRGELTGQSRELGPAGLRPCPAALGTAAPRPLILWAPAAPLEGGWWPPRRRENHEV